VLWLIWPAWRFINGVFETAVEQDYRNRSSLTPLIKPLMAYMSEEAAVWVAQLLVVHGVELIITRERSSKYADYRPPWRQKGHVITLNANLRPLSFLLIFLHEYAHLLTWVESGPRVRPHGPEWAAAYARLVHGAIRRGYFPEAMHGPLRRAMRQPQVSGCAQPELMEWLRQFEGQEEGWLTLEKLEPGTRFETKAGMIFEKGPKGRTRYRCRRIPGGAYYVIHQSLLVRPLNESTKST
jgi:SprT protein